MKKKFLSILVVVLTNIPICHPLIGQNSISNHEQLSQRLKSLATTHPAETDLASIARTYGGYDIWALTVGKGDRDNHPAIAVVSGIDGAYISGPEMVIRFAENLVSNLDSDSISSLLDSVTFYIFPNLSPDATEQYFAELKYERTANSRPTDDDRDGRLNEDPYEDLNRDGYITMTRIKDPTGEWRIHDVDPRIMVKADKEKGEKGSYLLFMEGIDNDKDRKYNEDGPGGIAFNRNMTYQFKHFSPGAGPIPVSEPESRALLDFLYDKWNIFAVFSLGPADNLSKPMTYDKSAAEAEIITGIQEGDAKVNAFVSEKYNEITGKKHHQEIKLFDGGFMQWAYFHYCRFSYGTPAFFVPEIEAKKDTLDTTLKEKEEYHEDVNFLRWADSVLTDDYFQEWTPVVHPGFEDREAEVGGFYPFVRNNPPPSMIDSLTRIHGEFIVWLASMRPDIRILNLKTTELGNQVYRVEFDIYNEGEFPVMTDLGKNSRWIKKPKIEILINEDQEILSGKKITLLDQLEGDQGLHMSWLIQGKGSFKTRIGSPQTGFQEINVNLN